MAWTDVDQVAKNDAGDYQVSIGGKWQPVPKGSLAKGPDGKYKFNAPDAPAPTAKPEEKPGYLDNLKSADDATKAAINKPGESYAKGLGRAALGAGETALGMVGGIAGDIAAASGSEYSALTGSKKPEEWGAKLKTAIQQATAPRTEAGKAIAGEVGAATKPLGDLFEALPKYLESKGHTGAANDIRAFLDIAGGEEAVLGKGVKAAIKDTSAAAVTAKDATKGFSRDAAAEAQKSGYAIPVGRARPSLLNKAVETLASLGSENKYKDTLANKNQAVSNDLVRKAFGLGKDTPLDVDAMKAVRAEAKKDYDALANVKNPNVKRDATLIKDLNDAAASYTGSIRGGKNSPVVKIVNDLKKTTRGGYTIDAALNEISVLRDETDKAYASGDKALGKATKAVSKAIEDSIERHLSVSGGDRKLLANFKKARETYAKSYSIQAALDGAGNVNAVKLGDQLRKDKPLSGDIKTVAKFGANFKDVAKTPKPKFGFGVGLGDTLAVGGGLGIGAAEAVHAVHSPLTAAAAVAAKPLARHAIKTDVYQKTLGRAQSAEDAAKSSNRKRKSVRGGVRGAITAAEVADQEEGKD